jgi:hypothetical protein
MHHSNIVPYSGSARRRVYYYAMQLIDGRGPTGPGDGRGQVLTAPVRHRPAGGARPGARSGQRSSTGIAVQPLLDAPAPLGLWFGWLTVASPMTDTGDVVGTLRCRTISARGRASDVYSLGLTLYNCSPGDPRSTLRIGRG